MYKNKLTKSDRKAIINIVYVFVELNEGSKYMKRFRKIILFNVKGGLL